MGFYHLHGARIKKLVCIGFNLTHHIARRTFASTLLLFNNVPIEVVNSLLGHSKMQTSQESYRKVVEKRISLERLKVKGSGWLSYYLIILFLLSSL